MNLKNFILAIGLLISTQVQAQYFYKNERFNWMLIAKRMEPKLIQTIKRPSRIVSFIKDEQCFLGWKTEPKSSPNSLFNQSFKKHSGIILDFGEHLTGFVSFKIEGLRGVAEAPICIKFIFGEVPAEFAVPFDPNEGGLSRAWLQDEIITISEVPKFITIPRRFAFRYVKMELLGSSKHADFKISDIFVKATTSVKSHLRPL